MSTPLSDWTDVVRVLLGDLEDLQRWSDAQILRGLVSAVKLNKLPDFVLDDAQTAVEPAIEDPNHFALLAYYTAELFLAPEAHSYSKRQRSMTRSYGARTRFLSDLQLNIQQLECGAMFDGWQSYQAFFEGKVGLPLWATLSDVAVDAPIQTLGWPGSLPGNLPRDD